MLTRGPIPQVPNDKIYCYSSPRDLARNYEIHTLNLTTSSLLLDTTSETSSPHTASGRISRVLPSASQHSRTCFSASFNSKTTQFSRVRGSLGSQRTRVGRVGTSCGGTMERPRWISSKMSAISSSSMGRRLETLR